MKNSIQRLTSLLVIIASFFVGDQLYAQSVKLEANNIRDKNRVYVSPLNLLNPLGSVAQITYGRVLDNGNELQFSYGKRLKFSGMSLLLDEEDELLWHFWVPRSRGGFRIGGEYQINISNKNGNQNYMGVETYYDLYKMTYWEKGFEILDAEAPLIIQTKLGLNFKVGRKVKLGNRLFLDLYAGLGVKFLDYKIKDINTSNYEKKAENSDRVKVVGLAVPINMKFAYTI